jgi:hypothetical protein
VKRCGYTFKHAVQIAIDIIIPETKSPETSAGKTIIAQRIAPSVCIEVVLASIDLNDQAML